MEQKQVNYTTISKFINKVMAPNETIIFSKICLQLKRDLNIDFEDVYIDETKYEANTNKDKFV